MTRSVYFQPQGTVEMVVEAVNLEAQIRTPTGNERRGRKGASRKSRPGPQAEVARPEPEPAVREVAPSVRQRLLPTVAMVTAAMVMVTAAMVMVTAAMVMVTAIVTAATMMTAVRALFAHQNNGTSCSS